MLPRGLHAGVAHHAARRGNHMFAFTVDAAAGRLYAIGSCGYAPGFAALDLATGSLPAPVEPPPPLGAPGPPPCGVRIAPGGPWAAVARVALAVPDARRAGAILLVDTRLGETFRSIPTPAEPLDVAVVPGPG